MQRAVAVFLGIGHVVIELVGDIPPQAVHQTQRGVTVLHLRHQDADSADVVDLGKSDALALHLPPDAVDMLGAPGDFKAEAGVSEHHTQLITNAVDKTVALQPLAVQQARDLAIGLGIKVAERQVFQLPLEVTDTKSVGKRCIYVEHLLRHLLPAL